jgi:hypothetical protein
MAEESYGAEHHEQSADGRGGVAREAGDRGQGPEAVVEEDRLVAPAVFRVQAMCRYCGKARPAEEILTGAGICVRCLEWHQIALDLLAGKLPRGCQECGLSFETIRALAPGAEVKMYVVPRDGIYQVLCRPCCDVYVRKARTLYRGTAFAKSQNL